MYILFFWNCYCMCHSNQEMINWRNLYFIMNKFSREFSSKSCLKLSILTVLNSLKETQVPGPGEGQQGDRRHLFQDVSHPGLHGDRLLCRHLQWTSQGQINYSQLRSVYIYQGKFCPIKFPYNCNIKEFKC